MSQPQAWPAEPEALESARRFLSEAPPATVIIPDGDADGLAAGMQVYRTLEALGNPAVVALPGKGEHVHHPAMRQRLAASGARALVVLDMGSRGAPILSGVPTLIIDHHQPRGVPPGAQVLSAFGHEPVATTSLLTYTLLAPLADPERLAWLAAVGTVGDLGADAPFDGFRSIVKRFGRRNLTEAVALLNAPKRSAAHDIAASWDALLRASSPADLALGRVEGVDALQRARAEVASEIARCSHAAPRFAGRFALVRMRSQSKVHPILAKRWSRRLAGYIVVAANSDYLPGRVNFSMRTTREENLIEVLRGLGTPLDEDVAYGHPQATGGSLRHDDFARLLGAMGFLAEAATGIASEPPGP